MKYAYYILCFLLLYGQNPVIAQSTVIEANSLLDAEQLNFSRLISSFNTDPGVRNVMLRYGKQTTDSLQEAFNNRNNETDPGKIKSINCLAYFLQSLRTSLNQ